MVIELVLTLLMLYAIVIVESFQLNFYYRIYKNNNYKQPSIIKLTRINNDLYNRKGQHQFTTGTCTTNSLILLNLSPKRNEQSSTSTDRINNHKQRKLTTSNSKTTTTTTTTTTTKINNYTSDFFLDYVSTDNSTDVINGPFNFSKIARHWGKKPILIRNAFNVNSTDNLNSLATIIPSWDDIISLSCWDSDDDDTNNNNNNNNNSDENNNEFDTNICSGESARLIQHTTGKLKSFDLQIGPFDTSYLKNIINRQQNNNNNNNNKKWTLIVNDINKYVETVQRWMDNTFNFISRWRCDDIQISIANNGGGIGPHVDNYDVCLLQLSGYRYWEIFPNVQLSIQDEYKILIPNLSVRIVNMSQIINSTTTECQSTTTTTTFTSTGTFELSRLILYPGDMLYLPPRIVHCGTAISDNCMTVSVGFRSPSASDIVNTVAESIQQSIHSTAVQRYTDPSFNYHHPIDTTTTNSDEHDDNYCTNSNNQPSITQQVRDDFKDLLQNSVSTIINDTYNFDKLIGELITRPIRYSDTDIIPYPYNIDKSLQLIFGTNDATNVLETMIQQHQQEEETGTSSQQQEQQQLYLIVAEGVSCATSYFEIKSIETNNNLYFVNRLYARGIMYEVVSNELITTDIFTKIENGIKVYSKDIIQHSSILITNSSDNCNYNIGDNKFSTQTLRQMIITLIQEGILKPQI